MVSPRANPTPIPPPNNPWYQDVWSGFMQGAGPESPISGRQVWPGIANEQETGLMQQPLPSTALSGIEWAHQNLMIPGMANVVRDAQDLTGLGWENSPEYQEGLNLGPSPSEFESPLGPSYSGLPEVPAWNLPKHFNIWPGEDPKWAQPPTGGDSTGRVTGTWPWDNFRQFVDPEDPTSGTRFSPTVAAESIAKPFMVPGRFGMGVLSEGLNQEWLSPQADNVRTQRVNARAREIEEETGNRVTQRQKREISQELYPLPPGMLGALEEAPYFAIPPAKVIRSTLQATRLAQKGAISPVTRSALKIGEEALRPLQAVETAAETAIKGLTWPIRKTGQIAFSPLSGIVGARAATNKWLDATANLSNEEIFEIPGRGASPGMQGAQRPENLPNRPDQILEATNQMVHDSLDYPMDTFKLDANNKIVRNKTVTSDIPTLNEVNARHHKFDEAFDNMFPKLTGEEIANKYRARDLVPPQLYDTQTGRAFTPEEIRRRRENPMDTSVADVDESATEYPGDTGYVDPEMEKLLDRADTDRPLRPEAFVPDDEVIQVQERAREYFNIQGDRGRGYLKEFFDIQNTLGFGHARVFLEEISRLRALTSRRRAHLEGQMDATLPEQSFDPRFHQTDSVSKRPVILYARPAGATADVNIKMSRLGSGNVTDPTLSPDAISRESDVDEFVFSQNASKWGDRPPSEQDRSFVRLIPTIPGSRLNEQTYMIDLAAQTRGGFVNDTVRHIFDFKLSSLPIYLRVRNKITGAFTERVQVTNPDGTVPPWTLDDFNTVGDAWDAIVDNYTPGLSPEGSALPFPSSNSVDDIAFREAEINDLMSELRISEIKLIKDGSDWAVLDSDALEAIKPISADEFRIINLSNMAPNASANTSGGPIRVSLPDGSPSVVGQNLERSGAVRDGLPIEDPFDMSRLNVGITHSGQFTVNETLESRAFTVNHGLGSDFYGTPGRQEGIYNETYRNNPVRPLDLEFQYEIRDSATGRPVWRVDLNVHDGSTMVFDPQHRAQMDEIVANNGGVNLLPNEMWGISMYPVSGLETPFIPGRYHNASQLRSVQLSELSSIAYILQKHLQREVGTEPIIFFGQRVEGASALSGSRSGKLAIMDLNDLAKRFQRTTDNNVHLGERAAGGVGAGAEHQTVENISRSGVVSRNIENMDDVDRVVLETKRLSPGVADFYVKLMFSMHDSTYAIRILQDNFLRSINPQASFRPGSHRDLVAGVILSSGAPVRGMKFYEHFIRTRIEPLLGDGVEQWMIERYIQAKHWLDIERAIGRENMPRVTDPRDPSSGSRSKQKEWIDIGDDWRQWIDNLEIQFGTNSKQFKNIVKGAEETRDVYVNMRQQLLDEGILSQEQFDAFRTNYPWYNPIDYHEYMDGTAAARNMTIVNTGIYGFVKNADVSALMAMPPLGETMVRRMISHELRLHRNRVTRAFVEMGQNSQIGLVDATNEFAQPTNFVKWTTPSGEVIDAPQFRHASELYDDNLNTGYFSYYENGERLIFGMVDATTKKVGPVDKQWWDAINGRAGLGVRGQNEVNQIFATSNSFFKATYTEWDPLFMIGNGMIDQVVVAMKYRIMPNSVMTRLLHSLVRAIPGAGFKGRASQFNIVDFVQGRPGSIMLGKDDRFAELMQYVGAYQNLVYDANLVSRNIQREITKSGHLGAQMVPDNLFGSAKVRWLQDRLVEGARKYFPVPTVGQYVEQAPRLLTGEKSLKKHIGRGEYNRLMRLPRADWEEELYRNYNKTGQGLIDTAEVRQAGVNSMESTINFFRGGDVIRRWNNYIMFLNAAFEGGKLPFRMMGVDVHPNIIPVEDAERGGKIFQFGEWKKQFTDRRGATGKYDQPLGLFGGKIDPRMSSAFTVGIAMTSYAGLQLAHNFQHPEYFDIPLEIRQNSLIYMQSPDKDEDGFTIINEATGRPDPNYVTIPHRLREIALFFGTLTHVLETVFTEEPTSWTTFAKNIWHSSSPINQLPLPQIATVFGEEISGYDFYRQEAIVSDEYKDMPLEEQYSTYTPEVARIVANFNSNYQWMPEIAQSPKRTEHMYENLTGGLGTRVLDGTSYVVLLLEDLRKNSDRPMKDKVKDFRQMNRVERNEFQASLTAEEDIEFQKEIRKPYVDLEGNMLEKILQTAWLSTGIEQRFSPDRGGAIRELQISAAESLTGLSNEQTRKAANTLSEVRRHHKTEQQADDAALLSYQNGGEGISPTEWRERKKTRYVEYQGGLIFGDFQFPKSVQGKDPEVRQAWYDAIYTAGGTMTDVRSRADLLVAGFYNILSPDDDPSVRWSEFFSNRKEYTDNIKARADAEGDFTIYTEFERALKSHRTETEIRYMIAMEQLIPYWESGMNLSELVHSDQVTPQLTKVWEDYLLLPVDQRGGYIEKYPIVDHLLNQRKGERKRTIWKDYKDNAWMDPQGIGYGVLDATLSYWHSWYEPITPQGREMHKDMWSRGSTISSPIESRAPVPVR